MEEKQKLKQLRSRMNPAGLMPLAYYGIMNVVVMFVMIVDLIIYLLQSADTWNMTAMLERIMQFATSNGWGYLLALAVGAVIVLPWKGFAYWKNEVFARRKKMTPGESGQILCVFLSAQAVLQLTAPLVERLFNLLGLSVMAAMEAASISATGFSMFLYVSFLGPVAEELLFRGLILRRLEPYGKRFAVLASAVLFGLLHGNVIQIPFAFAIGLVLGYVTVEYSVVWAIVLHIVNNFVLADLMGRLAAVLPAGVGELILFAILAIAGIIAAAVLVLHWAELRAYKKNEPMDKLALKGFFTAPAVLIFGILMLLSSLLTITRI